jgi:hypothetical protein
MNYRRSEDMMQVKLIQKKTAPESGHNKLLLNPAIIFGRHRMCNLCKFLLKRRE